MSLCMFTSFPNFALFVFICHFQGFPLWCNSCTCPPPRDDRCAERKPAVWIGLWIGLLLYLWDLVAVQGWRRIVFSIFLDLGSWILRNAIADQEQVSRGDRRKGHSRGRSW